MRTLGVERALVEVDAEDDVEAGGLQRRGNLVGIVDRIGELRDLLVGRVADHERDALFRGGGECEDEGGGEEGDDAIQGAVHEGYQAGGRNWRPRSHQTSLAALRLSAPPPISERRLTSAEFCFAASFTWSSSIREGQIRLELDRLIEIAKRLVGVAPARIGEAAASNPKLREHAFAPRSDPQPASGHCSSQEWQAGREAAPRQKSERM